MQQAEDFRQESRALAAILDPLSNAEFDRKTQFKGWTINDVIGHLHLFNVAAAKALAGDAAFDSFIAPVLHALAGGKTILQSQYPFLDGLKDRALFDVWRETAEATADSFAAADPKQRLKWVGPSMSAISSITARQMETWAHGQEVFDLLGAKRQDTDRIRNIVHLGVNTFGWTFQNRGLPIPDPAPYLRLTAPSGAIWEWNTPQDDNAITGPAVAFAQVVTQVRNLADTKLETTGPSARHWMQIAQCFAGPPETPPTPGQRFAETG